MEMSTIFIILGHRYTFMIQWHDFIFKVWKNVLFKA